jgi:hypothetical protein
VAGANLLLAVPSMILNVKVGSPGLILTSGSLLSPEQILISNVEAVRVEDETVQDVSDGLETQGFIYKQPVEKYWKNIIGLTI